MYTLFTRTTYSLSLAHALFCMLAWTTFANPFVSFWHLLLNRV